LGLGDDYYQTSAGQRDRLLTSTERLGKTSERIQQGRQQLDLQALRMRAGSRLLHWFHWGSASELPAHMAQKQPCSAHPWLSSAAVFHD
jgi:hypothetical protein